MKKIITVVVLAATVLTACNDSFLEKYPLTDLTEENAFKEYDNFKAFMNPCYEMFTKLSLPVIGMAVWSHTAIMPAIPTLMKPSQRRPMGADGTLTTSEE